MTAVLRIIVEPKELFHVLLKGEKKEYTFHLIVYSELFEIWPPEVL